MNSKEALEYLRTCKFCKIVMGTDYENDDRYPTIYDIFYEEIEIIEKDLNRLEELEKAIEILKNNLYLEFNDECIYICLKRDEYDECDYTIIFPSKEDYDLLKEVLK